MRYLDSLSIALALGTVLGSGCALDMDGPEDVGLAVVDQEFEFLVPRAEWERAPAGCEDAPLAELRLAGCEGEPTLGALLDGAGGVVCVDALSVLRAQRPEAPRGPSLTADPSPQPSTPDPFRDAFDGVLPPNPTDAPRALSAPGPVVQRDPTPTPVMEPNFVLRRGVPVTRRPDKEDPTPTPTTEQ